jgi:signal transduction histidine kinase
LAELDPLQREARARELRHETVAQLTLGTHRIFRALLVIQPVIALVLAAGPDRQRVFLTLILGMTLSVPALFFMKAAPRAMWVRHFVALCQVGWSMTFLWLLHGRHEAQLHLFVSLAFLSFYRSWPVLLTAATAAALSPVIRLVVLPEPVVIGAEAWRQVVDRSVWVCAEVIGLLFVIQQSLQAVQRFAQRSSDLQLANEAIARDIQERTAELRRSREQYRLISETTRSVPFELDPAQGRFTYIGPQAEKLLGFPEARWKQPGFLDHLLPRERENAARTQLEDAVPGSFETMCSVVTGDDRVVELRWTVSCEIVGERRLLRGLMIDVTETRRLVREIAQGQKLESVGRIAAGVAHEINTSVQFISDSVRYVRYALKDVPRAIADYRTLAAGVLSGQDVASQARRAGETDEAADVDYFLKNAPDALDRALDGIGRVGSIVRSMTEFTHPDTRTKADVDINRAVRGTLNMARNEYKGVAELVTDFGEVPAVRCHAGDVNQVVLNLLLNAAHAIGDMVAGSQSKGRITVCTRTIAGYVEISIADTGNGIAEGVRERIFEPFVTTKEVGRGTGQGLALSRGIVVEKLKGSLHFETETGKGTTFFIRLPVSETATTAAINNQGKQAAA